MINLAQIVLPISVVIPTLGGSTLNKTIFSLNKGTFVPFEIIVCIPDRQHTEFTPSDFKNVKVLRTKEIGQVAQRAIGFREASQHYVLQLDDDIELCSEDISSLYNSIEILGPKSAVAPIYFDKVSGTPLHQFPSGLKGFIANIAATVIAGAPWGWLRMGRVSLAGTNYGVDPNHMQSEIMEVDWVLGGCVIFNNPDLIKENYYPFLGKAYCEDLIHSYLLKLQGTRLWVIKAASCRTTSPELPLKDEFKADRRARIYFNRLRNINSLRFWIWYYLTMIRRI